MHFYFNKTWDEITFQQGDSTKEDPDNFKQGG